MIQNSGIKKVDFNLIELQQKLKDNGIYRVYGDQLELVIEDSELVKVKVTKSGASSIKIEGKFPTIGNTVQILTTLALLILFSFSNLGLVGMILAIMLGQGLAYLYYKPKIEALRKKVARIAFGN